MVPGTAHSSPESLLAFYHVIFQLKKTRRTGWLKRGMSESEAESISDHMYRMSMIAMTLPMEPGVDRNRCIMIALVHDLAEAIVGDITPDCGVSAEKKHQMEADAMHIITKDLDGDTSKLLLELWREYEAAETAEAKIVKQIDKFEFALQAVEYENEYPSRLDYTEFVNVVDPVIKDRHLRSIYDLMREKRHNNRS